MTGRSARSSIQPAVWQPCASSRLVRLGAQCGSDGRQTFAIGKGTSVTSPRKVKDSTTEQRTATLPQWAHWAATAALTLIVAYLDVTKPGDHGYSIFYLAPVLYVGFTVVGRAVVR